MLIMWDSLSTTARDKSLIFLILILLVTEWETEFFDFEMGMLSKNQKKVVQKLHMAGYLVDRLLNIEC